MKPAVFFKTVLQCLAAASFIVAFSIFLIGIAMLAMFGGTGYLVVNMMRYISGIVSLYGLVFGLIASLVMTTSTEYADLEGFWTGKKLVFFSLVVVLAALLYNIYATSFCYNQYQDLLDTFDGLSSTHSDVAPVYLEGTELRIAAFFNYFFYVAVSDCNANATWFWFWVNQHCPFSVQEKQCVSCPSFMLSFCGADTTTCTASANTSASCAYNICRKPILGYYIRYLLRTVMAITGTYAFLYLLMLISGIGLLCSSVKDKQRITVVPLSVGDMMQFEVQSAPPDAFGHHKVSPVVEDEKVHELAYSTETSPHTPQDIPYPQLQESTQEPPRAFHLPQEPVYVTPQVDATAALTVDQDTQMLTQMLVIEEAAMYRAMEEATGQASDRRIGDQRVNRQREEEELQLALALSASEADCAPTPN